MVITNKIIKSFILSLPFILETNCIILLPPQPPPQDFKPSVHYDGGSSVLGGLIGGGTGSAIGGILGNDLSTVVGMFGGLIGGAIGSYGESERNGFSVLGGSICGGLGAGAGVHFAGKLFPITASEHGISELARMPTAMLNSLGAVGNFSKPLQDLAGNATEKVGEIVSHPVESVGKLTEGVKQLQPPSAPVDAISSLKTPLNSISSILPMKRSMVTDLATNTAKQGLETAQAAGNFMPAVFAGMLKPVFMALFMNGILGALGGAIGAYLGSFGGYVLHSILVAVL